MPRKSKRTRSNESHKPQELPPKFKAGFLTAMDGRTDLARALRTNYEAIVADVGGREDVGHVKSALVERFVWLEAILQTLEHEMATGKLDKGEALGRWVQAVNALSGLAKVLGVDRKARSMPWLSLPPVKPEATNGQGNGESKSKPTPVNGNGHVEPKPGLTFLHEDLEDK